MASVGAFVGCAERDALEAHLRLSKVDEGEREGVRPFTFTVCCAGMSVNVETQWASWTECPEPWRS